MRHPTAFIERQRRALLRLRDELTGHTNLADAAVEKEVGDVADRGSAGAQAELNLTLSSMGGVTLREIDLALERIRRGTYGVCELTGELIPAERLEALPFTRHSIKAARQVQQKRMTPFQYGILDRFADEPAS